MRARILFKRISDILIRFILIQSFIFCTFYGFGFNTYYAYAQNSDLNFNSASGEQENDIKEIIIIKDESMLNENKVNINISVPANTYTIILPDGNSSIESNLTYEVCENGQYIFEFVDIEGNSKIKVVHVNTLQNRKETKLPKVIANNGKIRLESDSEIEYSINNKKWEIYKNEIEYKEPIYARVNDEKFECSVIKITLKQNGELTVENTESRELKGEVFKSFEIPKISNEKEKENEKLNDNIDNKEKDTYTEYSLIYKEFSYAECEDFKDEDEKKKVDNGEIYSYKKIKRDEKEIWEETIIKYAYIDNKSNLMSNIDIIEKAKNEINKINNNVKYVKFVGDTEKLYILTEDGDVYFIGEINNAKTIRNANNLKFISLHEENKYFLTKLDMENIINIYDDFTAKTKDEKIISLRNRNEEELLNIEQIHEKTDKYLEDSKIGLKNNKLYIFKSAEDKQDILNGKLVKSNEFEFGIYSEENNSIKIVDKTDDNANNNQINKEQIEKNNEYFIKIENISEDIPQFVDIIEYNNISIFDNLFKLEGKQVTIENLNENLRFYAITKTGEIWTYLNGYMIYTGINLNLFNPIVNYTISNTNSTNEDILIDFTEDTKNILKSVEVQKEEKTISNELPAKITENGEYLIRVTDKNEKASVFSIKIENIDKLGSDIAYKGKIEKGVAKVIAYDKDDNTGNNANSGISKIEITYEKPKEDTNWTSLDGKIKEDGKMIAQVKQVHETNMAYVRTIDNAGNIGQVRKIEFKEELDEEEQKKQVEEFEIEESSLKIEEQEFNKSNYLEVVDEKNSDNVFLIVGIIIIISISISMYMKIWFK